MRLKDYKLSLGIALLFHVMVVLALTKVYWPDITKVGWSDTQIIQSYLYKPHENNHSSISSHKLISMKINPIGHAYSHKQNHNKLTLHKTKLRSNLTQGQHNNLLIELHNTIEQNQTYPNNARLLGQQGQVKVSFQLLPSGQIINIKVLKNSGYPLLDAAAINAVATSSPFKRIRIKKSLQLHLILTYSL